MAGSSRYIRYILLAFLALSVIFFISSSSSPGVEERVQAAKELLKSKGSIWLGKEASREPQESSSFANDDEIQRIATEKDSVVADEKNGPIVPPTSGAAGSAESEKSASPNPHISTGSDGLAVVPDPSSRANATFVTLARNGDVWEISRSIRQVEDRFNHNYHYDWVFLNDADFDETFKKVTSALVSGRARYGKIGEEHWGFPDFIDQDKAARVREDMHERKIIYGDSISYRHMCRYESGFFFRHPLMLEYEYYWRVEPSIELFCDVAFDPFKFMKENDKKYSFTLSLYEYVETIPTLWDSVKGFMKKHPEHVAEDNSMYFLSDDNGETYNHCHFWSNFEIGSLEWLRSKAYLDYFDYLDHDGGFFYERWGDAPVHSIAAAVMLQKDQIHFFNEIAYYHVPFTHCPTGEQKRLELKCHCDPNVNFDWNGYSCTNRWYDLHNMTKPEGWDTEDEESGEIDYEREIYEINWAFWAIIFVSVLLGVVFSLLAILLIRPCMNFYRRVFWEYEIGKGVYKKLDEHDYDEYRQWELEVPKPRRRLSPGPKSADPRTGGFPPPMSPRRAVSYHNRSQSNEIRPPPHRRGASTGGNGMGLGISEKPNSFLHPP